MAGDRALEEAVVALRVEETLLVEARPLELVVYVGREDKVISPVHNAQQVTIRVAHWPNVALVPDDARPPRPQLLRSVVGIETTGVLVLEAVALGKVSVEAIEPLPGVGELWAAGSRETRASTHKHSIVLVQPGRDLLSGLRGGLDRFARPLA